MTLVPREEPIFLEMDRRDQQQIVMEMIGEVAAELFYEIRGKKGLSYAGVNQIAFHMGDIKTEPWVMYERLELNGEWYWSATVRAIHEGYNLASLGTAEAPELMEVYDRDERGNKIPDGKGGNLMHREFDHFCRRKALSMAQRNAKRAVMPEPVVVAWLSYFVDKASGKQVEPPFKVKSEFRVLKTGPGEDSQKKDKAAARTPQLPQRPRKVSLAVIEYNLKAVGIKEEVGAWEEAKHFVVEPTRELTEMEQYKIDETLKPLGAVWEKVGFYGRWRIPKPEEEKK